jgi:fatty-acyl-CoA synthase
MLFELPFSPTQEIPECIMNVGPQPISRQELSPIHFIERAGAAFADWPAVEDGDVRYNWSEFRARVRRLASALRANGLEKNDRVAFLAFNSEPLLLAHFGVPMAGGVIVPINTRLAADEIAYIVEQSGTKTIFYAPELAAQLVEIGPHVRRIDCAEEFESLIATGSEAPVESWLEDEYDLIAINYTSGTTGRPKGVMFHHRGAFLNALAMALDIRVQRESSYLWTLPMFHCNGWTFPWALAAVGARSVCMPAVDPALAWQLFDEGVTHFCAAPTVLTMLANDPAAHPLDKPVRLFTAGAPPSPTLIAQMTALNFELEHVYGLTETYGPCTINLPPPGFKDLSADEQATLRARQGFPNLCCGDLQVVDDDLQPVPADGATMGEVVMRGNLVMIGYFDKPEATDEAFAGGWFHSGDLAVLHPDGSFEIRDRKKDIIISGGENISTVEIEQAVASHEAVMECAVVPVPHDKWGEVPKAFVTLKTDVSATEEDILDHCRNRLARFKVPKSVAFGELPKTSTGKIKKFVLREREWEGREKRVN